MYIPEGYTLRVMAKGKNLFEKEYKLGPTDYPVHTSFSKEVVPIMPLWPLLVDFFIFTCLTLGQLSPIIIRIIGGIVALNKAHGTYLGLHDPRYCYSFSRVRYGYSLSTRNNVSSLVLALPNSHKGVYTVIIIIGFLKPDPTNSLSLAGRLVLASTFLYRLTFSYRPLNFNTWSFFFFQVSHYPNNLSRRLTLTKSIHSLVTMRCCSSYSI